jgi:tRNA A-37 threonylcarbamoyl transferase component Bud32
VYPTRGSDCLDDDELLAYLEGAPTARPLEAVQAHLDACHSCRRLASAAVNADGTGDVGAPSARTFRPGERIGGRYVVARFVAAGGMGEVYEAHDELLGERIALKTLPCTRLDSQSAFARLRSEVQLARKVTHPNVCRILEFGVHPPDDPDRAIPFFTMELLAGRTLGQRIAQDGPLPPAEAGPLAWQLVSGLAAIHAAGIVHRDLKSENVFLLPTPGPDGAPFRVVVMDFGLARPTDVDVRRSFSRSGMVVGTRGYMAPEQLVGFGATMRSDLYSVGVVLYEALTGRLPYEESAPCAVETRPAGEPAPAPRPVAGLPPEWDPIVRRCLEAEPEKRFESAASLLALLERRARPAPPPRPRARRRLALGAGALVTAGAAAGAWLLLREGSGPDGGPPADLRPLPPWGPAQLLETVDTGFSTLPHLAANRAGAAAVVWQQEAPARRAFDVWGRHHHPERGWGEARLLDAGEGRSKAVQVAIDDAGRSTAVWLQIDGGKQHAFAARFEPATGWSAPERLDEEGTDVVERVRVAAAGAETVVAWHQHAAGRSSIRARRLEPGRGFSAPEAVSVAGEFPSWPDVAVDRAGGAVVVWVRGTPNGHAVVARRHVPGAGWEAPAALEAEGAESTVPLVAVDASGRAVVVWRRPDEPTLDIWASPFVPGRGWGPAARIERGDEEANFSRVAIGDAGEAIAIWKQAAPARRSGDPPGEMRLWANVFSFDRGWQGPRQLPTPKTGKVEKPEIQMDAEGRALVVWSQRHERRSSDIWAIAYEPRSAWGRPRLVEGGAYAAADPAPAFTAGGHGFVVWTQSAEGEFKLFGTRF